MLMSSKSKSSLSCHQEHQELLSANRLILVIKESSCCSSGLKDFWDQFWVKCQPYGMILYYDTECYGSPSQEEDEDFDEEDLPKKSYCGLTKDDCSQPFPQTNVPRCHNVNEIDCKPVGKYAECYCHSKPPEIVNYDVEESKGRRFSVGRRIPVGRRFTVGRKIPFGRKFPVDRQFYKSHPKY